MFLPEQRDIGALVLNICSVPSPRWKSTRFGIETSGDSKPAGQRNFATIPSADVEIDGADKVDSWVKAG